jgi:predicted transcriptional regulator
MATPLRAIRIDSELWEAAGEVAEREGTSLSVVMREALAEYVKKSSKKVAQ